MKAVITGASKGIGKAIALLFASKGVDLAICARNEKDLKAFHEELREKYPQIEVLSMSVDMALRADIEKFVLMINSHWANLDILVNNAGLNIKAGLTSISVSDMDQMYRTNLVAPLLLMQALIPKMSPNGGRVVNIGSIWGVRSYPERAMYSMTKFGLDGMTRSVAREFGENGILVNTVAPGFMNTEMTNANLDPAKQKELCDQIPLGRFAETKEVAELVYFLVYSAKH